MSTPYVPYYLKAPDEQSAIDAVNATIARDVMYANPGDFSDADLQELTS